MNFVDSVRRSMRMPKLEDYVRQYKTAPDGAGRKQALWGIRETMEKRKSAEDAIRLGVIPILVKVLNTGTLDETLWACWCLRFLSASETGSTLILQEASESGNAVDGLVRCIKCLVGQGRATFEGDESAHRSLDVMEALSMHLSTQFFLARDDVYRVLAAVLGCPRTHEACTAARIYYNLSEAKTGGKPHYLAAMATPETIENLRALAESKAVSPPDQAICATTARHLVENAPVNLAESESAAE